LRTPSSARTVEPVQEAWPSYRLEIDPELEGGVYANLVSAWHTPYEFTLDFAAAQRPSLDDPEGSADLWRVVSRVRIPVALVFDVIRELNETMTSYERKFGEIRRPREL
jgi:hypothetical protein